MFFLGECLIDLCSEDDKIQHAKFSADGKYLVTLCKESVKIWNIAKKKVSWSIEDDIGFQVKDKFSCNVLHFIPGL